MGIIIADIRHTNELYTGTTKHLQGNKNQKVVTEIDIRVEAWIDAHSGDSIGFAPEGYLTNDYIISGTGQNFEDFNVGDLIDIANATSGGNNGTGIEIIEKINAETIRCDRDFDPSTDTSCDIAVSTPINGLRIFTNIIANAAAPNFNSLTTGEVQSFSINNASKLSGLGSTSMIADGAKSWQFGSATIIGTGDLTTGGLTYSQTMTISIEHYIIPFGLPTDFTEYEDGVAPSYFLNNECLKWVARIDAGPDVNDPNQIQTVDLQSVDGNTGWIDENFNGKPTNYVISGVNFERVSDTQTIDAPQLIDAADDQTEVTFTVTNTTDTTPFVDGVTDFILTFNILPQDESNYIGNGLTLDQNFLFDRAKDVAGGGGVNGDEFGTDRQVIQDFQVTFVSSSVVTVAFKTAFASAIYNSLEGRDSRNYALEIQTATSGLTPANSNAVTLGIAVGDLFLDREIDGVVTFSNNFLEHYSNDFDADEESSLTAFIEGEYVSRVIMTLNKSIATDARLRETRLSIQATDGTDTFNLEQFVFTFDDNDLVSDIQFIDFTQDRPFPVLPSEARKPIRIIRRTDLDTATTFGYEFRYPWIHRWETWIELANVNGFFFDSAQDFNGFNNEWDHYEDSPWSLQWSSEQDVRHSGITQTFSSTTAITSYSYDEQSDWGNEEISSFEADTLLSLDFAGVKYLRGDKNVLIRADLEKVAGEIPLLSEVWMKFYLYVKDEGTDVKHSSASSVWDRSSVGAFAGLITVTNPSGNIFRGEVEIDTKKIDLTKSDWTISAEIGQTTAATPANAILQEDGFFWLQEDGSYIIQE